MARELDLDQLSDAMRMQQEHNGNTNGKKIVWDKNTMNFIELNSNEQASNNQSVVNGIGQRGFYQCQIHNIEYAKSRD